MDTEEPDVIMELHYLLNAISDLPDSEYKTKLWNKTQEVCDIAINERPVNDQNN